MNSTSSTAILARDFSDQTTDVLRNRWTPGKVRHVAAALRGAPVAVVIDSQTGHTAVGVTLGSVTSGPSHSWNVAVTYTWGEQVQVTRHSLASLGEMILPLEHRALSSERGKWAALESWRLEQGAAIEVARALHPECDYGAWKATPGHDEVSVVYTSQKREDGTYGRTTHVRVPLSALPAEAVAGAVRA